MRIEKSEIIRTSWFRSQEVGLRNRYLLPYFLKAIGGYVYLYKHLGKSHVNNLHHMTKSKMSLIEELHIK
jgi:hypothetical protein